MQKIVIKKRKLEVSDRGVWTISKMWVEK